MTPRTDVAAGVPADQASPPVPARALAAVVFGLVALAAANGLVQVALAQKTQLDLAYGARRPASLEQLERRLSEATDPNTIAALRKRIEDEVRAFDARQAEVQVALRTAEVDGAQARYHAAWLAAFARVLVLLGAYGLARSTVRHHQIAGLAMLGLFVYALVSDLRLSVG